MLHIKIKIGKSSISIHNPMKISNAILNIRGIFLADKSPQRRKDEIHIFNPYHFIVVIMDVLPDLAFCAIFHFRQVIVLVKLMIARNHQHLPVILRCPIPEGMILIILISQITYISGENQNVAIYFQRIFIR